MGRIQQLPPSVVTKIAAGEVIERPASVVKELLENSVDAGARRIDVELEQGGVDRITVIDDGGGIQPEDLPPAFASHATSKLRDADDLFRIGTLGFRGEALASIGGVARVTLQSRPPEQPCGAEIHCAGGDLSPVRPWNGAPGTRIEVRHLFFNTPVRKKFLRTTATELGHVCEAVTRLALAYPDLHLTLRHNGKLVYEVPGSAGLPERIGLFFGSDVRERLYELKAESGPVGLWGFVADPACERGNAKCQYLFVNGRWVRDRSLGHAIQEAYRGLLMTGRYAVVFLFLDVPPELVDVNVHPTKCEVRFRDGQGMYHLVRSAIRKRLTAANLVPLLQVPEQRPEATFPGRPAPSRGYAEPLPAPRGAYPGPTPPQPRLGAPRAGIAERTVAPWETLPERGTPGAEGGISQESPVPRSESRAPRPDSLFLLGGAPMKAMQIHDAYLVVETPEGVLVIDQHALHERILYEQFRRRFRDGELERQRLLIPEPIDLPAEQAAAVLECREALAELGLEVEDFGGGTVLLSSYPTVLGRSAPAVILRGVIDFLTTKERPPTREQLLNDLMATMACKAACKAGDRLTEEEIAALMAQRELAEDSHHCPHGRPTSLLFSRNELDKQFRRV
ncbi:MAG TPA: DNA mismatch repair endonuclease MutL [Gemmataceae bacterium]